MIGVVTRANLTFNRLFCFFLLFRFFFSFVCTAFEQKVHNKVYVPYDSFIAIL